MDNLLPDSLITFVEMTAITETKNEMTKFDKMDTVIQSLKNFYHEKNLDKLANTQIESLYLSIY